MKPSFLKCDLRFPSALEYKVLTKKLKFLLAVQVSEAIGKAIVHVPAPVIQQASVQCNLARLPRLKLVQKKAANRFTYVGELESDDDDADDGDYEPEDDSVAEDSDEYEPEKKNSG